ncbi:MAG: uracil-DNA glycosylase [Candidatus Desantisbacteria bacterium]
MLAVQQEYFQLLKLTRKYIEQETGARIPLPKISRQLAIGRKKEGTLERIEETIQGCKKCQLSQHRKNIVLGTGDTKARLMIIGEALGEQEDIQGQPFVGAAGQLLTKMLAAINIEREDVYITNVVKCRPENNREPHHDEIEACNPYLISQIKAIKPKIILCLGNFATKTLLGRTEGISILRGKLFDYQGIKLLPTYHPAALLYQPALKRDAWIDMQLLQKELG